MQFESAALLLTVGLSPYKIVKSRAAQFHYVPFRCGLSPNKNVTINALTSKLAGRYYYIFTRLVAYAKYLFNNPSNAFPCLASSRAISCTVSWIASRPNSLARLARSNLPDVAPFSASTLISRFFFVLAVTTSPNNSANFAACSASSQAAFSQY